MEFEPDDFHDLSKIYKEFDNEMMQAVDRISLKYSEKLDNVAFNKLGYRNSDPEDKFLRFTNFCEYARRTYLIPSMQDVTYCRDGGDGGVPQQSSDDEEYEWD